MRGYLRAIAIGCAAGLIGLAGTGAANARSSPAVPVPEHSAESTLTLLGASPEGVAVEQDAPAAYSANDVYGGHARILSGVEGSELVRRTQVDPNRLYNNSHSVLGVLDGTLAWTVSQVGGGSYLYEVHRMNVRTGTDTADGYMPEPLGLSGNTWLSDRWASVGDYPHVPVLKRYPGSGGGDYLTGIPVEPESLSTTVMAADDTAALRAFSVYADGAARYGVDLIDLEHGNAETLVDAAPDAISSVALSPTTIAWSTKGEGPPVVHVRARAGGAITSYAEPDPHADVAHLAAADGSAAYLVDDPGHTVMRVVSGTSAQSVDVPDGSSGIGAASDHYLTAVGGPASVAGVYSVKNGSATRTATVPPWTYPLISLAMTGSQLFYSDGSVTNRPGTSLWHRAITGRNRPSFGPESPVTTDPAEDADLRDDSYFSVSAGRGAVTTSHDYSWHLLDRGTETGTIRYNGPVKVSGPYTLAGGKVYGTEGNLVYTEPTAAGESIVQDDIFGPTVVYAVRHENSSDTEIWMDDVEHPGPVQLASGSGLSSACSDTPYVAIWGSTVAWDACDGSGISVRNLVTKRTDTIPATWGRTFAQYLTLGEGVLAWTDEAGTHVVDLTSAGLVPVVLPGHALSLVLDDHRIARALYSASGNSVGYDVQTLPFPTKNRPRLIGTAAPFGFTPDGDGHADVWRPQFDVTKSMRKVELTIADLTTGKALRSLTGTAADGSIRDLAWNGLDKRGAVVPIGTYRWTLTGKATDGDGALIGRLGQDAVQGTIEVDAVGRTLVSGRTRAAAGRLP